MPSDTAKVVSDGAIKTSSQRGWKTSAELLTSLLFFVALWAFWTLRYGDYLYAAQENCIFLYRWEFLTRWLNVPDGLLCYLSSFVVQFFYYPVLGGAILAGLGVAVQLCVARLLKAKGAKYALTFAPSCLITISATWPAFFVFIPFNVPLIFSEPLGLLFAFAALALFKRMKTYRARLIFALVFVPVCYRLVACWATIACIFFAIDELTRRENGSKLNSKNFTRALWLVLAAVLIPLAMQRFWLFPRLKIYNVFTCGLIEDVRYDRDSLTAFFSYRFVEAVPLFLFVAYLWTRLRDSKNASVVASKKLERAKRRLQELKAKKAARKNGASAQKTNATEDAEDKEKLELQLEREARKKEVQLCYELLFLMCCATFFLSYHTRAFFDSLKELRALENANWERILEVDATNSKPLPLMVGLRNLALYKTGRLAEEAFLRPVAGESTLTVDVEDNAKALSGNPLAKMKMKLFNMKTSTERSSFRTLCELEFCFWGLTNVGARVATDNFVATEDRSISFCKTLAFAAVVNGERELARRYLREVAQTLFYKKEASAALAFIDSADFYQDVRDSHDDADYTAEEVKSREKYVGLSLDESAKRYGVSVDSVKKYASMVADARSERPMRNRVSKKAYPNATFLMEIVNPDEYDDASLKRKEVILIAALLQKKGDFFMEHIDDYLKLKGCEKGGAPRAIEQGYATWRYSRVGEKWKECEYQFTPETQEYMDMFVQYTMKFGASGVAIQTTLRRSFAGYYWGYAVDESTFRNY